jgi:hypothetical protein
MPHLLRSSLLLSAVLLACALLPATGQAQTVVFEERFDDDSQFTFTTGTQGSDGDATNSDYAFVTDGSNVDKAYDGVTGSFFAAQDVDGFGGNGDVVVIEWTGIDISSASDPVFSALFGEVFDSPGDIDDTDFVKFEYRVDGGSYANLIAFENDGSQFNSNFFEDTDFDGVGDGRTITSSSPAAMEFFDASLPTGTTLDLRLTIHLDSGDEDIAIDDVVISDGVIPVELAAFDAAARGATAELTWTTASETNNSGFAVQHRTAGQGWSELGFVEGAGTTAEATTYRFETGTLDAGSHTFRLKQVDVDGTASFSSEETVQIAATQSVSLRGPNPVPRGQSTQLHVAVDTRQTVEATLYNVLGQQVRTLHRGSLAPGRPLATRVATDGLASGLYFVRVTGESFQHTQRLTVVR